MRKSGACILGRRGPGMQASGCQLLQAGGWGCPIEAHVGQAGECAWGRPARTLQAVTGLGLLAHDVQYRVDELRALCVVPLRPVVAGARLRAGHRTRSHAFTECARLRSASVLLFARGRYLSVCALYQRAFRILLGTATPWYMQALSCWLLQNHAAPNKAA